MITFQIPEAVVPTFNGISKLSTEDTVEIGKLLKEFPIGGKMTDMKSILTRSEIIESLPDLPETIFSFGGLLAGQQGADLNALANNLSEAFAKKMEDKLSNEDAEQLKKNLNIIFKNADSLKKTFKAFYLFSENNNTFEESSVITNLRLLFNDNIEENPECGVILHQLKIDYRKNNEDKSFYCSLSKDDLIKLIEVIQRTIKKEETIKNSQKHIHFITLKNE